MVDEGWNLASRTGQQNWLSAFYYEEATIDDGLYIAAFRVHVSVVDVRITVNMSTWTTKFALRPNYLYEVEDIVEVWHKPTEDEMTLYKLETGMEYPSMDIIDKLKERVDKDASNIKRRLQTDPD